MAHLARERDRWRLAAEKAAEELGRAHAERDTLQQQLAESEKQLLLWLEADNANRKELAEAQDHVRMVVESWRQLKAAHGEDPQNRAVPLARLLAHVGMLAGDSHSDAYMFLAALNKTMLEPSQQLAEAKAELRHWRGCPSCLEDHPENTICPPYETRVTGQAWRQRQTRQWAERARNAEALALRNAERAEVAEADMVSMQSALVAAGHEQGCPVVHAASVDCVPGSGCVDWRERAGNAEELARRNADRVEAAERQLAEAIASRESSIAALSAAVLTAETVLVQRAERADE